MPEGQHALALRPFQAGSHPLPVVLRQDAHRLRAELQAPALVQPQEAEQKPDHLEAVERVQHRAPAGGCCVEQRHIQPFALAETPTALLKFLAHLHELVVGR